MNLKATGSPVQVIEDVASQPDYGMADLGLPPALVFSTANPAFDDVRNADILPDGQRFVALVKKPPPPIAEIKVVTNWTERLKQLWK